MFGSWVTHIPHVKAELGLNDAELGIALFGMPLGLLAMNPFSPMLLHRLGLSRTTIWSTVLMTISFAVPLWMPEKKPTPKKNVAANRFDCGHFVQIHQTPGTTPVLAAGLADDQCTLADLIRHLE